MPPPYGKCRTDAVFGIQSASNAPYGRFQWEAAIPIGFFHLGLIAAPFTLSRSALIVAFALYVIVGCFGVTMGFHPHFTHRSFKTSKWLSYVLAILGCLASEGGPEYGLVRTGCTISMLTNPAIHIRMQQKVSRGAMWCGRFSLSTMLRDCSRVICREIPVSSSSNASSGCRSCA